jgi:hypothetical protein
MQMLRIVLLLAIIGLQVYQIRKYENKKRRKQKPDVKIEYSFEGGSFPQTHEVVETEGYVYIDDFQVRNVLSDSVKIEEFGKECIVTLSFVAESFEKHMR